MGNSCQANYGSGKKQQQCYDEAKSHTLTVFFQMHTQ